METPQPAQAAQPAQPAQPAQAAQAAQEEHARSASSRRFYSPIVELRQYIVHPGKRDTLIELFERVFIESQEALGTHMIGQFRDLDDPNRFVWLRGFADMISRRDALHAFYRDGHIWKEHRATVNDLISEFDNVLLLRPARPTSGFLLDPRDRPPLGAAARDRGLVTATIVPFAEQPDNRVADWFAQSVVPALTGSGATVVSAWETEPSENTFPALPVREGEHVFVWFCSFPDKASYEQHLATLARTQQGENTMWQPVMSRLDGKPQILTLAPTARSLVHG